MFVEVLKDICKCCCFLKDNLTPDNYPLVYEVAVQRYGSDVVGFSSFVLYAHSLKEDKANG